MRQKQDPSVSKEAFDYILENIPDGTLLINAESKKIAASNPFIRSLLGYSKKDLFNKNLYVIHSDKDHPRIREFYDHLSEKNSRQAKNVYAKRKDGSVFFADVSASIVQYNDRPHILAIFRDVTERENELDEIRKSKDRFGTLFMSLDEGFYLSEVICDESGKPFDYRYLEANPKFGQLIGFPCDKIIGKRYREFVPNDSSGWLNVYFKVALTGESRSYEFYSNEYNMYFRTYLYRITKDQVAVFVLDITEHKQAEELIKYNEGMLNSILEATPVGIGILKNRILIKVNPAFCRITGYTEEEIIGESSRIFYPDDTEFNRVGMELYGKMRESGVGVSEVRLKRKDGAVIYTISCLSAIDPKDISVGVTVAILDITKRKETEETLSLMFKNMFNAFIMWESVFDEKGKYVSFKFGFFNDAFSRISGLKKEDVLGKDVFVVWPETEKSWVDVYGSVATAGIPMTFDMYHKPTKGWYHVNAYRPTDSPDRVCAIFEEITERRQAEEALRKNEVVLKNLFNAIPVGISLLSNRIAVKVNDTMCKMLGYTQEELVGKDAREIYVNEEEYNRIGRELYGQMEREKLGQLESRFRRRDNRIIDVYLFLRKFDSGDISSVVMLAAMDITEAKKIESEKLRLEEQLLHVQKMEAIGTMAGGIAHDFNNILGGIFGYSELCLSVNGNPAQTDKYIREVIKAAERAKDLINRILTFSRRTQHELKPVIPKYIIKEVFELLRASTPAEIELKIKVESDSAVMAEPTLIHQVLLNLCSNSIYAMHSKPGVIEISLEDILADEAFARMHPGLKPGNHIIIRISDTGSGIAPEHIDHIFDPFFTTKPKGEGTGLGLSVVHGIIQKLNGAVSVYSKPGAGTRFNIILPAIGSQTAEIDRSISQIKGGAERILLVDDEEFIAESLGSILSNHGYKVKAFTSSKDAAREFEANPGAYDIIITDYSMPHMTGIELVKKIKGIRNDIPIILNSGYINKSLEENASQAGINILLTKPVSTYQITDAIRTAFSIGKPDSRKT